MLRTDEEWMVRVFAIPLLMVAIAALRYAYVQRNRPEDAEDAAGNFHSHIFGVVFLVYRMSPLLCSSHLGYHGILCSIQITLSSRLLCRCFLFSILSLLRCL